MKDVWIKIKSIQQLLDINEDAIPNIMEVLARGRFAKQGSSYFIDYDEVEENQNAVCRTMLNVILKGDSKEVKITKKGKVNTILTVIEGERVVSFYEMGHGGLRIGVLGEMIKASLNESGGTVELHYKVDVNAIATSNNIVQISITPVEKRANLNDEPDTANQITNLHTFENQAKCSG